MTVTLVSNATADKASFVYVAENGLTNMRNGAAVTVVGTMPSSTVNGHAALGTGAAVDSYLSAQINGAVAANQSYSCILVGVFTTATDSSKPALWAGGSGQCRPKIVGNYAASDRRVSASCAYAGLNQVGAIPASNWTSGTQLSIIVGRNTSAGIAGSLNNAATVDGYNDATLRGSSMTATDPLYFGGSPVLGGAETAQAGFAVSMCAFFVGVSPEELRTYIGADPWADKIVTIGAADTTAPTLTSPTGTQTGSTTASGTVSTDEANGTLYYLASTNSTETAATVKAASSQAVSATGSQSVSFTGLTASTTYYAHYCHRDAAGNDSTVANSAGFTTAASPTATLSVTLDASVFAGIASVSPLTVLTATMAYAVFSGAATVSPVASLSVSSDPATFSGSASSSPGASITLPALKNNTGTVWASETGATAYIYATTGAHVVTKTAQTTNVSGVMTISDAALVAATEYRVVIVLASGAEGMERVTAA